MKDSVGAAADAGKGPVQTLCKEIGFDFDPRMERPDVLVAFVGVLVAELEQEDALFRRILDRLAERAKEGYRPDLRARAFRAGRRMLAQKTTADTINLAAALHDITHEMSDEFGPCDHTVDMLASCASALRFGLESPCMSRHAASAAGHVWKRIYGVSRFDSHTPAWEHAWARSKLLSAIVSLLPSPASELIGKTGGEG